VEILVRGDSGFCREHLMRWCEDSGVHFLFGLAKNARLLRIIGAQMQQAKTQFETTKEPTRVFKDFTYKTKKTWSRERRVVGKAEHLAKGENPRFVVTSLPPEALDARTLYEQEYCARGNMENRIKEKKLFLFADRVSCHTMRANQVRLCLSTVAYIVMRAFRDFGLRDTELAQAQCDTIRVKLLKIGATIKVSVRRIVLALSEAFPLQTLFERAWKNLRQLGSVLASAAAAPEHPPPDPPAAPIPN
jgi:hypothetical protein